jgi:hypothetical protein
MNSSASSAKAILGMANRQCSLNRASPARNDAFGCHHENYHSRRRKRPFLKWIEISFCEKQITCQVTARYVPRQLALALHRGRTHAGLSLRCVLPWAIHRSGGYAHHCLSGKPLPCKPRQMARTITIWTRMGRVIPVKSRSPLSSASTVSCQTEVQCDTTWQNELNAPSRTSRTTSGNFYDRGQNARTCS